MSFFLDNAELSRFINLLPNLVGDEIYFLCLAARTKYLNPEERLKYSIPNVKMFGQTLVREGEWEQAIAKAYSALQYKRTRSGLEYPEKSLVCYVSINPRSILKGLSIFIADAIKNTTDNLNLASIGRDTNLDYLFNIVHKLQTDIQKSQGTRHFIDIDVDSKDLGYYSSLFSDLKNSSVEHYIIKTKNGCHIMIKLSTLRSSSFRLHEKINELSSSAKTRGDEIKISDSDMIPLPGTMQSDHIVHFAG